MIFEVGVLHRFVRALHREMVMSAFLNPDFFLDCAIQEYLHSAARPVGHFRRERRGRPLTTLTTDASDLTAIGACCGYGTVLGGRVAAFSSKDVVEFRVCKSVPEEEAISQR